jgi:NAD dependent epimerase/dehydratase family enzyme
MGDELLLATQQAYPQRLKELGFIFKFPQLKLALEAEFN